MSAKLPWDGVNTPELSLADVEFLRQGLANARDSHIRRSQQPRPPSHDRPKKGSSSPRKKNGQKSSKGKINNAKEKKKSKKELEEEAAGFIIKQRKTLKASYIFVAGKLGVDPDPEVIKAMETNESVAMSQDERDNALGALTALVFDQLSLGAAHTRAISCAIAGAWVGQTVVDTPDPPVFADLVQSRPAKSSNPAQDAIERAEAREKAMILEAQYLAATSSQPLVFAPRYELLSHLAINSGSIKAAGARAVAGLLRSQNCTLTTLRLCSKNMIGFEGCKALGEALSFRGGNRSLVELYLDGDDSVGDTGVAALCSGLELNSTLKVLSMASCGMKVKGAKALAKLLNSVRCKIHYLNIEVNSIGVSGLEALCSCYLSNELRVLNMASIGIMESDSFRAVTALGPSLSIAKELVAVDFNLNPLTSRAALELTRFLAR